MGYRGHGRDARGRPQVPSFLPSVSRVLSLTLAFSSTTHQCPRAATFLFLSDSIELLGNFFPDLKSGFYYLLCWIDPTMTGFHDLSYFLKTFKSFFFNICL